MKLGSMFLGTFVVLATVLSVHAGPTKVTGAAESVSFENIQDGATLTSPLKIKMLATGIKIRPAGEAPDEKTSGHHHLIVDGGPVPAGQPIPSDDKHLHFGKGQTEMEIKLTPGKHALTLQFADGAHRSYGEPLSKTISVTVK